MEVLALSARPRNFDQFVGQDKIIASIRERWKKKTMPKGWLFCGERGSGKTSIARILALALQCSHQESFGVPCLDCRRNRSSFLINELNCGQDTGKADIESFVSAADCVVTPPSLSRVYILDEAHMLSRSAQTLLYKYFEDTPMTTKFIICSTDPANILAALRSRCSGSYEMAPLKSKDIRILVLRLLKKVKSKLDSSVIADAISEKGITSARLICNVVDNYIAGASPEDAVQVDGGAAVDTYKVCRALVKGDWQSIAGLLRESPNSDARGIRVSVVGYLKSILLNCDEIDSSTLHLANSISNLSRIGGVEDLVQMAATGAELAKLCAHFKEFKR